MTVTMSTAKKRTSPQDWIHDYYGPVLTVYASDDAEIIAYRNKEAAILSLFTFCTFGRTEP